MISSTRMGLLFTIIAEVQKGCCAYYHNRVFMEHMVGHSLFLHTNGKTKGEQKLKKNKKIIWEVSEVLNIKI